MLAGDQYGITGMTTGQLLGYMSQQQQPPNIIFQQQLQQQHHQQQQLQKQQKQIQNQQQLQPLQLLRQQLQQQQQKIEFPLQAAVSSPLAGFPSANQSQLSQQMPSQLQQFGQQKIIQQTARSPHLSSSSTPQVNTVAARNDTAVPVAGVHIAWEPAAAPIDASVIPPAASWERRVQ